MYCNLELYNTMHILGAVCDETQNLNDTDSETFFRYQIFLRPVPILFSVPKFSETGSGTFFGTNFFSRPVPGLFSVPNFSDTDSYTIKKREKLPGTGRHTLVGQL